MHMQHLRVISIIILRIENIFEREIAAEILELSMLGLRKIADLLGSNILESNDRQKYGNKVCLMKQSATRNKAPHQVDVAISSIHTSRLLNIWESISCRSPLELMAHLKFILHSPKFFTIK